jgi:hypothetical protein
MMEGVEPSLEADVLAATLQKGLEESTDLMEYLAKKFEGPLSHLLTVRRQSGLFLKNRAVEELTLRFEQQHFQLSRSKQGYFVAKLLKEVRGVVVKTSEVSVEDWLNLLAQELSRQAQVSQASHQALTRFLLE